MSAGKVVGHKTIRTGMLPGEVRHEPLTESEASPLWEQVEREKAARAIDMPTAEHAVEAMHRAYARLRELGWQDPPRAAQMLSFTRCRMIEPACSKPIEGSAHFGRNGRIDYTCEQAGDIWPVRPILIMPDPPKERE